MQLSIVTTLYRSAPHLEEFYVRATAAAGQLTSDFELVLVNDGSPDESLRIARALVDRDARVRVLDLARNFGHHKAMFYVITADARRRTRLLQRLEAAAINAVFHYVPLHSSPAGLRYGRSSGSLPITDEVSERLARLPMWIGMDQATVARVAEAAIRALD